MNRNLVWRGVLILVIVVASIFSVYPPKEKINLGLDLRGGMHLVLQVKSEDALRAETDGDMERLVQQAAEEVDRARHPAPATPLRGRAASRRPPTR